jgi:hypothetical protein
MKKRSIFTVLFVLFIAGCAHTPMKFQLAAGTNQNNYQAALKECGGDTKQGGYSLFGPLILVAPAVAVIEGVKSNQRSNIQKCMEGKGFKCIENCPDPSSANFLQKPVDPALLAIWAETVRVEKTKEWVFYADAPKGSRVYYDPKSISRDQHYISYREQIKFSPERTDTNLRYVWRSVKVNCADKIFKLSNFVAVDKAGNTTDPKVTETDWKNLPESSPMGKFAYKTCERRIIQQAEGKEKEPLPLGHDK